MIELWPFTNFHDLNLDWIIKTVKVYTEKVDDFIADITETWDNFKDWTTDEIEQMHDDFEEYVNVTEGALNTGAIADGAITESKINSTFLNEIKNAYVTPEQFGAVGDGVTDDTQAFQDALDSGLPVFGDTTKTYYTGTIDASGKTMKFCYLTGVDRSTDGVIVDSYTRLEGCRITLYDNAIVNNGTTVHAELLNTRVSYCNNGLVFTLTNAESINNFIVQNCYFTKCGPANIVDDYNATYTNTGYGIYGEGNIDGLQVSGSVFEYCAYAGIYLKNTSTSFRVGASITSNYFEGSKNCAIYIYMTDAANMINIKGNYFSASTTNVFGTRYMTWEQGTNEYIPEDVDIYTIARCYQGGASVKDGNQALLTETSPYFSLTPMKYHLTSKKDSITIYYYAELTGDITLRYGSDASNTIATFKNGYGAFTIGYDTSYFMYPTMPQGDSIRILKVDFN